MRSARVCEFIMKLGENQLTFGSMVVMAEMPTGIVTGVYDLIIIL